MFANKHFINTGEYISKSKPRYNTKTSAYYFYVRTKTQLNFPICISVPFDKATKKIPTRFQVKTKYLSSSKCRTISGYQLGVYFKNNPMLLFYLHSNKKFQNVHVTNPQKSVIRIVLSMELLAKND